MYTCTLLGTSSIYKGYMYIYCHSSACTHTLHYNLTRRGRAVLVQGLRVQTTHDEVVHELCHPACGVASFLIVSVSVARHVNWLELRTENRKR